MNKCLLTFQLIVLEWSLHKDVSLLFTKEIYMESIPTQGTLLYLDEELNLSSSTRTIENLGYHPSSNTWIIHLGVDRLNIKDDKRVIDQYFQELNLLLDIGFYIAPTDKPKLDRLKQMK